jgi:hypothetical protein
MLVHALARVPAAALLTAAAGLAHAAAAVPHLGDSPALGLSFAATAWAQLLAAVWVVATRSRASLLATAGVNVAALAGWALSRTVGLPVLHPAVEPVGLADGLTVLLETLAVGAAFVVGGGGSRVARASAGVASARFASVALVAVVASGGAVTALGAGGGHGHDDGHGEASAAAGGHGDGGHGGSGHGDHHDGASATSAPTDGADGPRLHEHEPGVYHAHEDARIHRHGDGVIHLHEVAATSPSPTATASPRGSAGGGSGGAGDGHGDGHGHGH